MVEYVVPDQFSNIQDAFNAIPTDDQPHSVLIRSGVYINNPEPWTPDIPQKTLRVERNNLTVRGEGIDKTIIRMWEVWKNYGDTGSAQNGILDVLGNNCVVKDLTLDGNHQNNSGGACFTIRGDNNLVDGIKATRMYGAGIAFFGNNSIVQNSISKNVHTGLVVQPALGGEYGCTNLTIRNNFIDSCGGDGILIGNGSMHDLYIEDNYIGRNGDTGIDLYTWSPYQQSYNAWIRRNQVNSYAFWTMSMNGSMGGRTTHWRDVVWEANEIHNGLFLDHYQGRCENITVKDCSFKSIYNGTPCLALRGVANVTVRNNTMKSMPTFRGIEGTATGIIEGNIIVGGADSTPFENPHSLKVESEPVDIKLKIYYGDRSSYLIEKTPLSMNFDEIPYKIETPVEAVGPGLICKFKEWENSSPNPIRTINLNTDMTLKAYYTTSKSYLVNNAFSLTGLAKIGGPI